MNDIALLDETIDRFLEDNPPATTDKHQFWGAQFDAGLAWVHFPVGYGGLGLNPKLAERLDSRLGAAGAPRNTNVNFMLVGMAGPTIVAMGSEEQKQRFLRPGFACDEIWCQLFSEPGAGSDLASLSTRAERDGDEWVFNGQKVWTTLAHVADWAMVLARTNPDQPKHKGLTYFLIDMRQPGIEVRPLRQINGEAEFNEVFLTDARTPDSLRIGDVGEGWRVAVTTLMNERTAFGHLAKAPRGTGAAGMVSDLYEQYGDHDPVRRDAVTPQVDRERARPAHDAARAGAARQGHARSRGFGDQARVHVGLVQHVRARRRLDGRRRHAHRQLRHGAADDHGWLVAGRQQRRPAEPAEGVAHLAGRHHRWRHVGDREERAR